MFLHNSLGDPWISILIHGAIWVLLLLWIFYYCRRKQFSTVGLPVCYIGLMSVLHFGAIIYLLPWYDPQIDIVLRDTNVNAVDVAAGFALSSFGVCGFAVGVWLSEELFHLRRFQGGVSIRSVEVFGRQLVVIGTFSFFVIFPLSARIPSGAAISSAGVNLAVVGLCLLAFNSLRMLTRDRIRVLTASLALPSLTMVMMGFVGFGVTALINVGFYVISFVRIRWWYPVVGVVLFWLALSFYVTYMEGRSAIREVVWRGASVSDRIGVIVDRFAEAKFFNPLDVNQLHLIDMRLNQNALVGKSVYYMRTSGKEFANGETLYIAATAWVPRLVWAGKPSFGGSGTLVSQYTGQVFSANTSVGIGQVLEFFINFGTVGVFCGFVGVGAGIRYIDRRAGAHLQNGEYWEYTRWHLIGVCAMQPGGMLAEIVASCAAAWLLMIFVKQYLSTRPQAAVTVASR